MAASEVVAKRAPCRSTSPVVRYRRFFALQVAQRTCLQHPACVCPVWLRSTGLLSRRQPSDLHLLLHRADTEAKKKTPRVAAPVLKELPRHAFCPLTVSRRWVGATRCVASRLSNLSSIRAQHEALGGHALHPLSWCFCPSASSSAQSGALPKRERQTPGRTSSRRCLHAQSGTGGSGRRHMLQPPDRGTRRLGVRDAVVRFPLRLKM